MKIKFVPQGIEVEIKPNQTVLHAAMENDVHIKSVCKGIPSCAECRVKVVEGEANLIPPGKEEVNLIGNCSFVDHRRLACQMRCFGDVTIDLTEQIEKAEELSKRPRGARSEVEDSKAVMGNIIYGQAVEDQYERRDEEFARKKEAESMLRSLKEKKSDSEPSARPQTRHEGAKKEHAHRDKNRDSKNNPRSPQQGNQARDSHKNNNQRGNKHRNENQRRHNPRNENQRSGQQRNNSPRNDGQPNSHQKNNNQQNKNQQNNDQQINNQQASNQGKNE